MQKWEYLFVGNISLRNGRPDSYPVAYRINSKGFELFSDFRNRLNTLSDADAAGYYNAKLGEEDWEMTGVGNTASAWHCLYFKRPKS